MRLSSVEKSGQHYRNNSHIESFPFFSEVLCSAFSCCLCAELFPRLAGFKWISACEEWEKQGGVCVSLASEPFAYLWNKCCFSNGRLFVFPLRLSLLTGRITTNQG